MAAVSVIIFDKDNKQQDYQSIARNMDGELVIGWIVIEKPWYSAATNWTYWMYSNDYYPRGLCGGATDLGLTRCMVDKNTIKPFTQIEKIKYDLEIGLTVRLDKKLILFKDEEDDDNTLAIIEKEEDIPYELWSLSRSEE